MNEEIIDEVVKRIRRSDRLYQINMFLKSRDISDDDAEQYMEAASDRIYQEKLKSLPRTNKLKFIVFVSIAVATFIAFIFIIPRLGFRQTTLWAIIGAIILSISGLLAIVYNKSWKEEYVKLEQEAKKGSSDGFSPILFFVPIPALIFSFIFSSVLESGLDDLLKRTQVEVSGVIIGGSSETIGVRRGDVNFSSVTVQFTTKEGETIHATEDVSEYEFKDFYKGQKVKLIYSSEDPQNIEFLMSARDIKKFKDSEEREINAEDLITLININDGSELELLNSISYGWVDDEKSQSYVNESKNMAVVKNPNEIALFTHQVAMLTLPKQFIELKFKDVTPGGVNNPYQGHRSLENDQYYVNLQQSRIEKELFVTVSLVKK